MPSRERIDLRFQPHCLRQSAPRAIEIAYETQCPSEDQVKPPESRVCCARLPEEVDPLINMAEEEMGLTQYRIRPGDVWIARVETDRLLNVRNALFRPAKEHQCLAKPEK